MKRMLTFTLACALAGCGGGTDADLTGEYTINLINGDNGCAFDDWVEGEVTTNIPLTIIQNEAEVSGEVGGIAAIFLGIAFGSNVYTGEVTGRDVEMILFGETALSEGNCAYTFNSTIAGRLTGDLLEGEVLYQAATNGNSDCEALQGCTSRQSFNGTRPPTEP